MVLKLPNVGITIFTMMSKPANVSRFESLACKGTYFQMVSYRHISDEPDVEFARRLTTQYKVAAIPPLVFYANQDDHKVLRFCFEKKDEILTEASERLCRT